MSDDKILLYANPTLRFRAYKNELQRAYNRVLQSNQVILGQEVKTFEESFASYLGVRHCVGVNSGTDALTLALLSCDLKPGDEVIVPALTAHGTVVAVLNAGLKPVIVDIKAPTFCIDPDAVERAISPKTKAVIPVHLHGFPADIARIKSICGHHSITLIEDCAQAHGAQIDGRKVGTFGQVSAFSFYPTKNLGCIGDGGAVVTNDPLIAERLKALRNYGLEQNGDIEHVGLNSRLDELQAAFLSEMLPNLDSQNERRKYYAEKYHEALSDYKEYLPPLIDGAVYHQFAIRVPNREQFKKNMLAKGIQFGEHYGFTMKDVNAFQPYSREIPVAEKNARELVSLPIQPEILDEHFDQIVVATLSCLRDIG